MLAWFWGDSLNKICRTGILPVICGQARCLSYATMMWLGLAASAGLCYLAVATWGYGVSGFPLDDAWIHQTYARNLARSGQLAFVPGVPSAGSTAPLWTLLLSLGYLFHLPYMWYTYALGVICLGLSGQAMARLTGLLFPEQRHLGVWVGLCCVLEWHLIWAAVSGMETILFVGLTIWLLERYIQECQSSTLTLQSKPLAFLILGLIGGLLILTRPEGLGLVGLVGLDMARRTGILPVTREQARCLSYYIIGLLLLVVPYMAFHWQLTGKPFPNTFYAKQAEYAIVLQAYPLWWRLFGNFGATVETVQGVFWVIFIGPQILLLPGLCFAAWLTVKERRFELAIIWAWWIAFLLLYGFLLPVTYQHGRYQMPAIVWILLLGLWGSQRMLTGRGQVKRVVRPVLALSLGAVGLLFIGLGAQAYGRDVRFIESEMVITAKWLNEHSSPQARLAAHDIGAIGYFAERPLLDLAGLVTPEVIPIIRDEEALAEFILAQRVNYVVTFPSWYPRLTQQPRFKPIYRTHDPASGSEHMVVYLVDR